VCRAVGLDNRLRWWDGWLDGKESEVVGEPRGGAAHLSHACKRYSKVASSSHTAPRSIPPRLTSFHASRYKHEGMTLTLRVRRTCVVQGPFKLRKLHES